MSKKNGRPGYIAAVLTEEASAILKKMAEHPVVHCHHMTLVFRPNEEEWTGYRGLLGQQIALKAIGIACGSESQAVLVNADGLPCKNSFPHVTVSCAAGALAGDSNELLRLASVAGAIQPFEVELGARIEFVHFRERAGIMIYTHVNLDLDAAASVWGARRFMPGATGVAVEFCPADWNGAEMTDDDIAVDITAGGRGLKGQQDPDGTTHACFTSIIATYAPAEDREALAEFTAFLDAQDAHGSAVGHLVPEAGAEAKLVLGATGINSVLRALQARHQGDDKLVLGRMQEIFDGMLYSGRARRQAELEADTVELFGGGKVALAVNVRQYATNIILFQRGVRVIVYVDGCNLGLWRSDAESLRMDHPDIKAVVEPTGELDEWYAHPAGFLFCRGSRRAPADTMSQVEPRDLAEAAVRLLCLGEEKLKMKVKSYGMFWDWRDSPDIKEMQKGLETVFDGKHCPVVQLVDHLNWDSIAIVISSQRLSVEDVRRAWDGWIEKWDEKDDSDDGEGFAIELEVEG